MGAKKKRKRPLPPLLRRLTGALITGVAALLGALPLRAGQAAGAGLGALWFVLDRRRRRVALSNLAMAFGEAPESGRVLRTGKAVFENIGKIIFESLWSMNRRGVSLFRHFRIEGKTHIDAAFARGRGVLCLTAHFGNWELLSVVGAMIRLPIGIVYRPLDFSPLDDLVVRARTRFGAGLIPKKKAFRRVYRDLARGHLLLFLMDQNVPWREGVYTEFFGKPAAAAHGMALLALKTRAPVIPVFLIREGTRFTAKFLPPVPLIETGDSIGDLEMNTARYTGVIETMVRDHPEQWFWVHDRWKTKPFCDWPKTP